MFLVLRMKKWVIGVLVCLLLMGVGVWYYSFYRPNHTPPPQQQPTPVQSPAPSPPPTDPPKKYIKWVDFDVNTSILQKLIQLDIDTHATDTPLNWVEMLAYLATKYGGEFSRYQSKDVTALVNRLQGGEPMETIAQGMKLYPYYLEAYTAIFDEFVGSYWIQVEDGAGGKKWVEKYGLKAYSPIGRGYDYSHYDDFGNGRSYGYDRKHSGHDLMGSIGTPVVAVESGTVEVAGWNQYGGWRIGIRSFDKKRYYYYAHLRKDHPFHRSIQQGSVVKAGDVIGFLGMTGYSAKENVNNINTPHLHFGLQLIFDESQKEGVNQIWIDLYDITTLLKQNRSNVVKNGEAKEHDRLYDFYEPSLGGQPPQTTP